MNARTSNALAALRVSARAFARAEAVAATAEDARKRSGTR